MVAVPRRVSARKPCGCGAFARTRSGPRTAYHLGGGVVAALSDRGRLFITVVRQLYRGRGCALWTMTLPRRSHSVHGRRLLGRVPPVRRTRVAGTHLESAHWQHLADTVVYKTDEGCHWHARLNTQGLGGYPPTVCTQVLPRRSQWDSKRLSTTP